MYRILREATPAEGGGVEPPPATPPAEKPAVTPPAAEPEKITVAASEYTAVFQRAAAAEAKLAQIEAEKQAAIEAERQAHLAKLAEEQGAKAALEEAKRLADAAKDAEKARADKLEADWLREKRENVIANSIAGVEFVSPEARRQALAILESRFTAAREGDQIRVRDSQGRYAADVVPAALATAEFSHFIKAQSRGGTGAKGGDAPVPDSPDLSKLSAGERALLARQSLKPTADDGFGLRPSK